MSFVPVVQVASDSLPRQPNTHLGHLTGPKGHWYFGNLRALLPDPADFLGEMRARYGDCFTVGRLFNRRVVVLAGPAANRLVLLDPERNFSTRMGWEVILDFFGGFLMLRDFEDHRIFPARAAGGRRVRARRRTRSIRARGCARRGGCASAPPHARRLPAFAFRPGRLVRLHHLLVDPAPRRPGGVDGDEPELPAIHGARQGGRHPQFGHHLPPFARCLRSVHGATGPWSPSTGELPGARANSPQEFLDGGMSHTIRQRPVPQAATRT